MNRFVCLVAALIVLGTSSVWAAPNQKAAPGPSFPGVLVNARFVYVASYDGDQFDANLLPEDRDAIDAVQGAIQRWGKLVVVYHPSEADIIILVTSRPSEDVLAVYDAHSWATGNYLWRVMGYKGLQSGETPLVAQFEEEFDAALRR